MHYMQIDENEEMETRRMMGEFQRRLTEQEIIRAERMGSAQKALDRLLTLAETRESGQIKTVALFIGACWNGSRHFDFFDFRCLDWEIKEDMFAVLLAHASGCGDIDYMLPDGHKRVVQVLDRWGMYGAEQTGQPMVLQHDQ